MATSAVAQFYSVEQRTPPLPLIALIGCPEVHRDVSDYFVTQLKPPLVTLSAGGSEPLEAFVSRHFDPGKAAASGGGAATGPGSAVTGGILKSDWLTKHRGRRPAVALVFVPRGDLEGDPTTWNRMVMTLKYVRDAVTPRGAGLVVAVLQDPGAGDLPPDRVTAICHTLALDPRMLCPVSARLGHSAASSPQAPDEAAVAARAARDSALRNLGALVHDQCAAYYARRSQWVADKHAGRQAAQPEQRCPSEMNARTAIKLAVYAEFRQDWRMAVSEYQAAYAHLRAVICGGAPPAPSNTPAGGPGTSTAVLRQQSMGGPGSHQGHTSVSSPSLPALAGLTPASSFSSYSPATTTGQLPLSPMPSPGGPGAGQPGAWGAAGVPLPMQPTHGHSASAVPALGGRPGTAGGFASTGGAGAGGPPQTASAAAGALTHSQSQAGIGGSGRGLSVTDSGAGGTAAAGGSARPPPTPQRFAQAARVAELVQLKLLMLLTYQKRLEEAVAQAGAHLQLFTRPPVPLPPPSLSAHLGFLVRQLLVTAEVLPPKLEGTPLEAAAKEVSRASLLMAAAQAAVDRKRLAEGLRAARAAASTPLPALDLGAIRRGPFVGQAVVRLPDGGGNRELSDSEYLLWVETEEMRAAGTSGGSALTPASALPSPSSSTSSLASLTASAGAAAAQGLGPAGITAGVLDVLSAAMVALRDSKHERLRCRLGVLMAVEHVGASNLSAARKLLLHAAYSLRRDGWSVPLAQVLLLLREVAARLRLPLEHVTYSLELAVILDQIGPMGATVAAAGTAGVVTGVPAVPPPALAQQQEQQKEQGSNAEEAALLTAAGPALEPKALCTSAVQSLLSGVSEISRTPIIKSQTQRETSPETPTSTSGSSTASAATPHHHHASRMFNYTVEYLDLKRARLEAERAGPGGAGAEGGTSSAAAGAPAAAGHPAPRVPTVADLLQRHHHQDFGWWRVLGVAVGIEAGLPPDCQSADVYVALISALPLPLPVTGVTLTVADDQPGEWYVQAQAGPLPDTLAPAVAPDPDYSHTSSHTSSHTHGHAGSHGGHTSAASVLMNGQVPGALGHHSLSSSSGGSHAQPHSFSLKRGVWALVGARLAPRAVGRLRVERVTISIGDHTTVTYDITSFPAGGPTLGSVTDRHPMGSRSHPAGLPHPLWAESPFKKCPRPVTPGLASVAVQHVGKLPELKLLLQPGGGPALVGEPFLLTGFIRLPQPTPASASPLTNTTSSSGSASTTGSSGAAQQGTGRASAAAGAAPGTAGSQVLSTSRAASTAGGGAAAAGGLPSCVLEFAVRPLPPTPAPGQPAVPGAGVTLPVTQQHGLLTPGDVTVIVDDRGSLEKYNGQDTARVQLPHIPPGGTVAVRLWVIARRPGRLALSAALQCPAVVARVVEFSIEDPWESWVRVLAEPLTHTLCALPPKPSPHSSPHQHSDHTQHAHGHAPPLGSMSVHGSFNALPHASQVSHTNLAASIHGSMGHLHGSHGAPGHGAHAIQPPGGASGTAGGPAVQPLPLVCGQPAITVCCLRRPQASQQLAPLQVVEVQVVPDPASHLTIVGDTRGQMLQQAPTSNGAAAASANAQQQQQQQQQQAGNTMSVDSQASGGEQQQQQDVGQQGPEQTQPGSISSQAGGSQQGTGQSINSTTSGNTSSGTTGSNTTGATVVGPGIQKGDVQTVVAVLLPTAVSNSSAPVPIGKLQVTWQRAPPPLPFVSLPQLQQGPGIAAGTASFGSQQQQQQAGPSHRRSRSRAAEAQAGTAAGAGGVPPQGGSQALQGGTQQGGGGTEKSEDPSEEELVRLAGMKPHPERQVTTLLDLPLALVQPGLLTVRVLTPPQVTAGIAFSFTLQLQNLVSTPQELSLTLLDATGFVLSGERTQQVTVPGREAGGAIASWLLVAHTAGNLSAPCVRLLAPRTGAQLITQPAQVYVRPF